LNTGQAIEQAIECIDKEVHALSIDANMHDIYQAEYRRAVMASRRRKQLRVARRLLEQLKTRVDQIERTMEK
jgi:cyclopropane fatty-acyl-phospholipid synthase-like methyltransferase